MAIRVELNKPITQQLITSGIASLKRSETKQLNPMMKELIEKDIAALQNALNTLTEIK